MFENPFTPARETYVRSVNPVKDYIEQAAFFLSRNTGISKEESIEYVKKLTLGKEYPTVRFPQIHYLKRGENGDRAPMCQSLLGYIRESVVEDEIIAPTLTTYLPPKVKKSILVDYIEENIKKRSRAKKAMFAAEAKGDMMTMTFEDGTQRNTKLSNNAISGAHASASNPLYNPTSHSTLTSNCRMTSAFGNANNEKLLCGNRHYHAPDIVMNNIVSIITHTDYKAFKAVMDKYSWYYPSTDDVMEAIRYSTDLYWENKTAIEQIRNFVELLSDIEKAVFLYTGDLYHIKKHNSAFIREFVEKLSQKVTGFVDNPIDIIKSYPEDIAAHGHQICAEEMKGKGKDYKALLGTVELQTLALTIKHIGDTLIEYQDFIKAIMVSDNVPASLSHFPDSIRRAALTSDTDSTIFTVQDWVLWLNDGNYWNGKATAYASSLIFIASQAIIHILARMSKNAGIIPERMYQIAMKNEFYFPVFIPTRVNKHYFASISCQEGNVYDKIKREVKGVHLKNSNSPKFIIDAANDMMNDIMDTAMRGEKISLLKLIKQVADIERGIIAGIKSGDPKYFRAGTIKQQIAYTNEPERSPYFYYMLWQEVFAPKYGEIIEPPFDIVNVATLITTPTNFINWLASLEDRELANRAQIFFEKTGKNKLPTIQIPVTSIKTTGMPVEIANVIDHRSIVTNLCKIFYLILETLGFYILNKNATTLMSDKY